MFPNGLAESPYSFPGSPSGYLAAVTSMRPFARRARWACAMALPGLACGCVQGPDYVKSAVEIPPAYRSGATVQSAPLVTRDHWWVGYGDRHLDALVEE